MALYRLQKGQFVFAKQYLKLWEEKTRMDKNSTTLLFQAIALLQTSQNEKALSNIKEVSAISNNKANWWMNLLNLGALIDRSRSAIS